jgi:peptide/nickel transport system substrate-binding protein
VDVGLVDAMPEPLRIEVIPYPGDEVGAQLIINDEIDVCLDVRPATMESILAQGGDHVVSYTGNEKPYGYVDWWPTSIWFNTLEKPYDDPRVRWAMAYAINQQTMIDVGLDGAGEVTGHPFPKYPGLMRYVEGAQDILDEYNVLEHNQEKVDELMTEAGYSRNEDGYWADENGDPLNADLYAAVPLFADIAPILVEMMRQAGFDANHMAPPDVWTAKTNGTALIHLFGHGGSLRDPFVTLDMYHSRWQKPTGENCGLNRARWANEEYDAIVEEIARLPMDEYDRIQELFNDAMRIWYRELPDLPLQQWYHRVPWNTTYWTGWPNEDDPYNNAPWQRSFIITLTRIKAAQA